MNQLLNPITLFPRVSEEPSASTAFMYGGVGKTSWIAYEIARDFLSAPRLFAIIELTHVKVAELDSQYEYADAVYLEDGSMEMRGWFEISESPFDKDEHEMHILLSLSTQRYEFLCKTFAVQARVYHQPHAQAALLHWLANR